MHSVRFIQGPSKHIPYVLGLAILDFYRTKTSNIHRSEVYSKMSGAGA